MNSIKEMQLYRSIYYS